MPYTPYNTATEWQALNPAGGSPTQLMVAIDILGALENASGSGLTGAENGLSLDGQNVILGGTDNIAGALIQDTIIPWDLTALALIFGDASSNYNLGIGHLGADGVARLAGDFDSITLAAIDATRRYTIGAESTNVPGNTSPSVGMSISTDVVQNDYGFVAFDDTVGHLYVSNIYYMDETSGNDFMSVSIIFDYDAETSSYVDAFCYESFGLLTDKNGWRITQAASYLYANGNGSISSGNVFSATPNGIEFLVNNQNYFTVGIDGTTVLGDPGVTEIYIDASLNTISQTATISNIITDDLNIAQFTGSVAAFGDVTSLGNDTVLYVNDTSQQLTFTKANVSINNADYIFPNAVGGANTVFADVAGGGTLSWEAFDTMTQTALVALGGVGGTFTTTDLKTVTVVDGIITDIAV